MKVTIKGQVTIPQHIREKLGITSNSEVDFIEEKDRVMLVKVVESRKKRPFNRFRGIAVVRMTTDEIMSLTRK
ncbi:MAG: AbrB/MazE/SpoVT family DNA-binding domain-containing protein [Spirochaetes bacterium]|nr:AbrB/MazE/SpoVT family DNA-binding domain-containing protein [Spirochaetota bacterium]